MKKEPDVSTSFCCFSRRPALSPSRTFLTDVEGEMFPSLTTCSCVSVSNIRTTQVSCVFAWAPVCNLSGNQECLVQNGSIIYWIWRKQVVPSDRHRLNELIDLHYCDTTSSLVWTSDGNKTVSSWNKSLAFSESRRLSEEERGGRRNVQTRSFSVLCSSRDITGFKQ